ncbi:MAG: lytic transglycosylase domain-containing protein [Endomicrobiales bacterium]
MKKIVVFIVLFTALVFSLFYFEAPFNLLRPVFHADTIEYYARKNSLDPLLVTALIKVESNFLRRARSHRGAVGLMQLMPGTAEELAGDLGYKDPGRLDLENPEINIRLGTYYLARLKREFHGSDVLALASYNAGIRKVQLWYRINPLIEMEINDIPYGETRNYVKNILKTHQWLKRIQAIQNMIRPKKA